MKTLKNIHQENRQEIESATTALARYEDDLSRLVSPDQLRLLQQLSISSASRTLNATRQRHLKKFSEIQHNEQLPDTTNPSKHVHNLSSRTLREEELQALGLGMKMC